MKHVIDDKWQVLSYFVKINYLKISNSSEISVLLWEDLGDFVQARIFAKGFWHKNSIFFDLLI